MTRNLVKQIFGPFSRLVPGHGAMTGHRAHQRRRSRSTYDLNTWDALEGRVVLNGSATWAWGGGGLLGTLSGIGVVTGPVVSNPQPVRPIPFPIHIPIWGGGMTTGSGHSGTSPFSQLETDWKALVTELQSLAAKSGVTVGDIESLTLDSQAIAHAGFHFNGSSLHNVISELATAVAGGTSTSQAQSDWNALFTGSNVSTIVITNTFNDLVTTIQASNVTTTDLSTVASDEAAIQKDLSNLWMPFMPVSASISDMGPSPLLATESVAALTVSLPNVPAVSAPAVQSVVNSLPVVSEPLIVSPGITAILPWGGSLFASLNYVGVVTGPVVAPSSSMSSSSSNSKFEQLITDVKALQTELQSLASKSGVTVAELQSLALDSQSIAQAGVHLSPSALNKVISELATAVAGGTSTSQAQSDWTALFTSSSVSTTVITNTFNDLVKAIGSSNMTTTNLTTVANNEAAIQTDLKNLFSGNGNNGSSGSGSSSGSSSGSGSSTGSTTGGSTGAKHTKPTPIVHRLVKGRGGVGKAEKLSLHAKLAKAARKKG